MSSSFFPQPTQGAGPGSSNGGGNTNSNNQAMMPSVTKSSSLLFGFLITFLALFVAFMGCGLGSRRALDLRRRRFTELAAALGGRYGTQLAGQTRPQMWDVWVGNKKGEKDGMWLNIMPLSATLIRPKPPKPPQPSVPLPSSTETPPQTLFPTFYAGRGVARIPQSRPLASNQPPPSMPIPIPIIPVTTIDPSNDHDPDPDPVLTHILASADTGLPPIRSQNPMFHSRLAREFWGDNSFAEADAWQRRQSRLLQQHARQVAAALNAARRDGDGNGNGGEEEGRKEGMHVAVLVAMPAPPRDGGHTKVDSGELPSPLGEYALGVAHLPWDKADLG